MLTTMANEECDDISKIIAIPIQSVKQTTDQMTRNVQNIVIKTLPNMPICLVEDNQVINENKYSSVDIVYLKSKVQAKNGPTRTIYLQPPQKKQIFLKPIAKPKEIAPKPTDVTFKCIKCEKEFETIPLYRKHMMWHRNMKNFKCTKCSAGYNNEKNLKIHMAMHSEGKPTCPLCHVTFQRLASLKSHLLLHQVEELYTCEECRSEFEQEDELIKHIEIHVTSKSNENKPLICPYCKVTYLDVVEYRKHISFHIKVKKLVLKGKRNRRPKPPSHGCAHVCQKCNKSFTKVSLLERHERIHSGEKPFVCQYCHRGFTQKGTLQIHLSKHTGIKPFQCTLCPAKFNQKGNLRVHIEKTHTAPPSADIKTYKCTLCTCIFKKVASLNGHMTKMHSDQNAENDSIETLMDKLKELDKQTRTNAEEVQIEGPAVNDLPGKMYEKLEHLTEASGKNCSYVRLTESRQDGSIRRYLVMRKMIADVRWYCCNYCAKLCKKPSDLIRHIRTHTREKPFKCKQCGSAFALKSTLMSHMNTHAGDQNQLKCNKCDNVFSSFRTLNSHLRKHEKNYLPNYQCCLCNKVFTTFEQASVHKDEHKDSNSESSIRLVLKQPLLQTQYGPLALKPPKRKIPTGTIEGENFKSRPHHCVLCNARFTRLINLRRHIKVHEGDRSFKCNLCPKAFISSYKLIEHLKYHNNIRQHECQICFKKFVTASSLKRHLIIHNNYRSYICPYCSKTFKTVVLTRSHIRKVHKKEITLQALALMGQNRGEQISENVELNGEKSLDTVANIVIGSTVQNNEAVPNQVVQETDTPQQNIFVDEQFYELPCNTIQILTDQSGVDKKTLAEGDQVYQTVYVNCEDLQLNDPNFCQNVLAQLKLQQANSTDSFLLNSVNDLQDSNIFFNVDPAFRSDFLQTPNQVYPNTNLINGSVEVENDKIPAATKDLIIDHFNLNSLLTSGSNNATTTCVYQSTDFTANDGNIINNNGGRIVCTSNLFDATDDGGASSEATSNVVDFGISDGIQLSENHLQGPEEDLYENTDIICMSCNMLFSDMECFKEHSCETAERKQQSAPKREGSSARVHEKKKPHFECIICNQVLSNRNTYIRHLATHTNSKSSLMRSCKFCHKDFKKPSDLKRHLRTHTGEKPFACDKCTRKFALKSTLDSHLKTHDPVNSKEIKCEVCNSFFSVKSSLKVHMLLHTGKKPHPCSHCPMSFRTAAHRRSHEYTQHVLKTKKKKPSKGKKITNLLQSMASEVIQNVNSSAVPSASAETADILTDSLLNKQQIQDNSLSILNISTQPEASLADHIQIDPLVLLQQLQTSGILIPDSSSYVVENQDAANATANSFLQLDDVTLLNFKAVDKGGVLELNEDDFQNFIRNGHHQQIELKATNEHPPPPPPPPPPQSKPRNFECDICNKKYASKDVLRKHKKIHGRTKKFPCTKCDKGFDKVEELEQHVKLHTGYRPFACVYCTNSFTEEHNLKTHVKRMHHHNTIKGNTNEDLLLQFDGMI